MKGKPMAAISSEEERYRILIIDDEADVLQTIADSIRSDRYVVQTESDPRRALDRLKNENFDIVLTDLMMPGVSGMDIVHYIAGRERADTEVVVITAHATVQTAIESLQMGVYD
ncbi:MAG TPA: response regulator, partial [Caldithrix abyssi]|nr:response regulator [Caldithrix abyssi]